MRALLGAAPRGAAHAAPRRAPHKATLTDRQHREQRHVAQQLEVRVAVARVAQRRDQAHGAARRAGAARHRAGPSCSRRCRSRASLALCRHCCCRHCRCRRCCGGALHGARRCGRALALSHPQPVPARPAAPPSQLASCSLLLLLLRAAAAAPKAAAAKGAAAAAAADKAAAAAAAGSCEGCCCEGCCEGCCCLPEGCCC
jgi:hypothetical protein